MMKEHVEDKLIQFLQSCLEPFSVSSALQYLGEPVTARTIDELSDYLLYNQFAFVNPFPGGEEGELWLSRAGLFTGKQLVIRLTQREISSGIMIPGSRFVPFANPALLPHELSFTFNGQPLSRVLSGTNPEEIYPLYQLFGEEYVPQYLSLDNEENGELFSPSDYDDPEEFMVSAVDMKDIYWSSSFKPGDLLLARLTDWAGGVFELSVLDSSRVDPERRNKWMRDFEDCLVHTFEISGPGASIDEQLAFAWFVGQDSLFSPDGVPMQDFLRWSGRVGLEPYGVETRLWYRGEQIPAQGSWNMSVVSAPATLAEESFMHLGLPVSMGILDACVLDALFRKETSSRQMVARLVPVSGSIAAFCLPVIERAANGRFNRLTAEYNWFADHEHGVLRNRFVILYHALVGLVLQLQQSGIPPDRIPDQGAVVLGQIMAHTISALESMCAPAQPGAEDVEALWASVEGMEDSFFEAKTGIQEALPDLLKGRFSIINKKGIPDE